MLPAGVLHELFYRGVLRILHIRGRPAFGSTPNCGSEYGDFCVIKEHRTATGVSKSILPFEDELARVLIDAKALGLKTVSQAVLQRHARTFDLREQASQVCDALKSTLMVDSKLREWAGFDLIEGKLQGPHVGLGRMCTSSLRGYEPAKHAHRAAALLQGHVAGYCASSLGLSDISTQGVIGEAMIARRRIDTNSSALTSTLVHVAGIPEIGQFILNNPQSFKKFVALRDSNRAVHFRKWFHEQCNQRSQLDIAQAWAECAGAMPWTSSIQARILRLAVTTGLSLVPAGPLIGAVASVADSLGVDALAGKVLAKAFITDVRKFVRSHTPSATEPAPLIDPITY